ncbi:MAG: SDR family oxidoreductase [Ignavibacteriae bacterium]|nr:MAG: SDR family oxidoreductase [Ignavibacteriota bacterium]
MSEFENKIAIVTGGTGGLGQVIVNLFANEGMKIYVPVRSIEDFRSKFDNSMNDASTDFKLRKIYAFQCNAENEQDVIRFVDDVVKREKRIDYLVNTVGGYHPKKMIEEMDYELIDKMMNLNFKSTFLFCKNVLSGMAANNYGRITAIGAMPAIETTPGKFAYSISKSNVVNLIQTIAEEYKENNIMANVIIPSTIDTQANRASMPDADYTKWVSAEDIAKTILYLCSDSAKSFYGNVVRMY